ncbi:MAG: ABC transporter ATP-binding protein [Ruminococcus sp.]|jgi:ABC-2 type transport system ATP-binding protein
MDTAISLRNVVKRYDAFTLGALNLDIPRGCITGLVGENGAGKTTMLKGILGLIHMDEGQILLNGTPLDDLPGGWKNDVGVILGDLDFAAAMNAQEIGLCLEHIYDRWQKREYGKYLKQFKIDADKKIKDYSKGMKMKLNLAIALSHDAKLLIFDEATSGLDPVVRDEILDILLEFIQDETHTVLISSHITSDLEKISDYIAFLQEGKLKFFMNKDEMLCDYGVLRCSEKFLVKVPKKQILSVRKGQFQCEVLVKGKDRLKELEGEFAIDPTNIEEIILFLVKGEKP